MVSLRDVFREAHTSWANRRVLGYTVGDIIRVLVIEDLERAAGIINRCYLRRAHAGQEPDIDADTLVNTVVLGILHALPSRARSTCLPLAISARMDSEESSQVIAPICGSGRERGVGGRALDDLYKYTEGIRTYPYCSREAWKSLFEDVLREHDMPPGIDPVKELDEIINDYEAARKRGRLKGIGPITLTYWLSLAYPEYYIPFGKEYCLYHPSKEDCLEARELATKFRNINTLKPYYVWLLKEAYNSGVYFPPRRIGSQRESFSLLRLHYLAKSYIAYRSLAGANE